MVARSLLQYPNLYCYRSYNYKEKNSLATIREQEQSQRDDVKLVNKFEYYTYCAHKFSSSATMTQVAKL
jgi:hypothetical protein